MRLVLSFIFVFLCTHLSAQLSSSILADFTVKETAPGQENTLKRGKVFYNKSDNRLIYKFTFPNKDQILIKNSRIHLFRADTLSAEFPAPGFSAFNMFRLALEGKLLNYGLEESIYKPMETQEADSIVVTTWKPSKPTKEKLGDIMIAHHKKRLHGVIFMDADGELLGKILFSKYMSSQGVLFPGEMVQVSYYEGQEYFKITTFSKLLIDGNETADWHKLDIPK